MNIDQKTKDWSEMGVADTIYEDDQEHEEDNGLFCATSRTSSLVSHQSSFVGATRFPCFRSTVEEWSLVHGCQTDVIIRFYDQVYHLHKEPLISSSRYLHRRLSESSEITITPPTKITKDTFNEVILFCYSSFINLTPSNLTAVAITAEWLEMDINKNGNADLIWLIEVYFRQEVAGEAINAKQVMSSSIQMLPHSTAALIIVRCVDILDCQVIDDRWMYELADLNGQDFQVVVESMRTWFVHDHDLLYQIIDCYLQKNGGSMTEELKNSICQSINCNKLSQNNRLRLVQNPHLPLRFIVQATLVDQLQTRRTYLNLSSNKDRTNNNYDKPTTLGAILKHDSALREAINLRSAMETTSCRIEKMEKDLEAMRRKLRRAQEKKAESEKERASSFRVMNSKSCKAETEKERASSFRVMNPKLCKRDDDRKKEDSMFIKLMNGVKTVFKSKNNREDEETRVKGHRRRSSFA